MTPAERIYIRWLIAEERIAEIRAARRQLIGETAMQTQEYSQVKIQGGLAYRVAKGGRYDGYLECAPVLADGTVEDNWSDVDFFSISAEEKRECREIQAELRASK